MIVIAHRGASGERPEHTLESYQLAVDQGADFIEPDLVMTRDGVLIARHENEIGSTTDVAEHPEFAARRRSQVIDGEAMTGWFTEDFTLAEIKTLRARERLPQLRPANRAFDGRLAVPTFDEIMQLVSDANRRRGGKIGSACIRRRSIRRTSRRSVSRRNGRYCRPCSASAMNETGSPVFIQSFDSNNLRQLRAMTRLPLVQLLEHEVGDLERIAEYADAIGIAKPLATAAAVAAAHRHKLAVHVWTFRAENEFLPADLQVGRAPEAHGDLAAEIARYLARGIDGFFTDFPAVGVRARDAYISAVHPEHQPLTDTNFPGNRPHGR